MSLVVQWAKNYAINDNSIYAFTTNGIVVNFFKEDIIGSDSDTLFPTTIDNSEWESYYIPTRYTTNTVSVENYRQGSENFKVDESDSWVLDYVIDKDPLRHLIIIVIENWYVIVGPLESVVPQIQIH